MAQREKLKNHFSGHITETFEEADETAFVYHEHVFDHFAALAGLALDYYGADSGEHTFSLDNIVFKVLADPNDGYRSFLGAIEYAQQDTSIFFKEALGKIRIVEFDDETGTGDDSDDWSREMSRGYRLIDESDNHVWLEFGTGNYDDYYPYFMFRHFPKEKKR